MSKNQNNKWPLYIFVHVPKCAGISFRIHIENNFRSEEILKIYCKQRIETENGESIFLYNRNDIDNYLKSLTERQRDKIKVIYGHDVYYGIHKYFDKEPRYFTFLRNPVDRAISLYNFKRWTATDPDYYKKYIIPVAPSPETRLKEMREEVFENGNLLSFESWFEKKYTIDQQEITFLCNRDFIRKDVKRRFDKNYLKEELK